MSDDKPVYRIVRYKFLHPTAGIKTIIRETQVTMEDVLATLKEFYTSHKNFRFELDGTKVVWNAKRGSFGKIAL